MSKIKEKYEALLQKVKEDDFLVEFVYDSVDSFRKYTNSVISMEMRIPMLRIRLSEDNGALQDAIMKMDNTRRITHERAIDACNQLNRLSENNGLEPFFEGDTTDRYQVADFCLEVCSQLFMDGQPVQVQQMAAEQRLVERGA